MRPGADVRSISSLQELDAALARFSARALDTLDAVEPEIQRRLEILEERREYWMHEVEYWQSAYEGAEDEEERSEAAYRLQEAKEELSNVRHYQKRVEECYRNYRRHAEQLRELCTRYTAKARAFLQKKIAELNEYVATQLSGISDSMGVSTSSTAEVTKTGMPPILDFGQSGVLTDTEVKLYIEERIPPIHLSKLTKIVYADTYKHDDSRLILGELVHNPLTQTYDTIIIYRQSPDIDDLQREMKMTIAHEIGHNVYFNVLDNAARAEWESLYRTSEGFVTTYASSNVYDDFAESYAYYILDPKVLLDADEEKYAFLRDRVFHGREYL